MNLHYFQHVPFEGLGCIEEWAIAHGVRISVTRLFAGESPPSHEKIDWLVVMGGPMGTYEEDKYSWLASEKKFIRDAIKAGKVVLGICLGAQLIANTLGAEVYPSPEKEIGWLPIQKKEPVTNSEIFDWLPNDIEVFHWHGDTFDIPLGAIHGAQSKACENQCFIYQNRVVALQFHLETTRQTANLLIENCGNEIDKGPYTQTAEQMLSNEQRFTTINKIMYRLLDQLLRLTN